MKIQPVTHNGLAAREIMHFGMDCVGDHETVAVISRFAGVEIDAIEALSKSVSQLLEAQAGANSEEQVYRALAGLTHESDWKDRVYGKDLTEIAEENKTSRAMEEARKAAAAVVHDEKIKVRIAQESLQAEGGELAEKMASYVTERLPEVSSFSLSGQVLNVFSEVALTRAIGKSIVILGTEPTVDRLKRQFYDPDEKTTGRPPTPQEWKDLCENLVAVTKF